MEIEIRDGIETRKTRIAQTGQETAEELLTILALNPREYEVKNGNQTIKPEETLPNKEKLTVVRKGIRPSANWKTTQNPPENIALTLAIHSAREGSNTIAVEVKPTHTPHTLSDTVVKRYGGINANDITQMVDNQGRNLMSPQLRNQTFADLSIQSGETLDVQADITQG